MMTPNIMVEHTDENFNDWKMLLSLLQEAFAYQKNRIDPPSSLNRLSEHSLAQKAKSEKLFLAKIEDELIGCAFVRDMDDRIYLGKLAVLPRFQGRGVGKRLMRAVEKYAMSSNRKVVELETRIELEENHATFAKLGFVKVSEGTHEGYCKPTFIVMRKQLRT